MKKLRVVFMGTPEFAVATLEAILNNKFTVSAVVTAPDKPAGRGRKLQQSAVKKAALDRGIQILQPKNLQADDFVSTLKNINPDVIVVVAFRMLPKKVWEIPSHGTFNLHASLLPQYRGAAPINWAIINGERETGITTFFIDKKIDTGKIILQKKVPVNPKDNAGDLHDKLMQKGADLVVETLNLIESGNSTTHSQNKTTNLKAAPKLAAGNTKIDWSKPAKTIYDQIRGLNPYPSAWAFLEHGSEKLRCKIYRVEIKTAPHDFPIGKILQEGKTLKVAVEDGFVFLEEIQLPGKRKMPVKELLNGFILQENPRMY